mgnify:CR=1 FL=1
MYASYDSQALLDEYASLGSEKGLFSDDKLYALAGWTYISGASADTINFEHPPFAKYLIGVLGLAFISIDTSKEARSLFHLVSAARVAFGIVLIGLRHHHSIYQI